MKELSIEEKAKRYDEALKEAVIAHKDEDRHLKATLERIFPELKESEDERIRKALINGFNKLDKSAVWYNGITNGQILAWLEKQGEQEQLTKYTLEQAARIFLDALSDTPYNNKPVTDAQVITRELLKFLSDARSYNPDALNEQNPAWSEEDEDILNTIINHFKVDVECTDENEMGTCWFAEKWLEKQGEKPVIGMKTPEESLGLDSDTYNKIVDECVYDYENANIQQNDFAPKSALEAAKEEKVDNQNCVKPADKVEPKFKVGDWVVYTGYLLKDSGKDIYVMQVASVEDYRYNFTDTSTLCFDSEKDMRSWTIQDAKDGDVLVDDNSIIIFRSIGNNRWPDVIDYYVGYKHNLGKIDIQSGNSHYGIANTVTFKPATKEQRDLLFQKMKEAGYEWDAEKKELKKIEQKPADLKITAGNWYVCEIEVMNENKITAFYRGEVYYCPKDGYIDVNGMLFEVGDLDVFRLATKEEIPQQKQEWSEEDKKLIDDTCHLINTLASGYGEKVTEPITLSGTQMIASIKYRLRALVDNRPQNTWKPSDEQMNALWSATEKYLESNNENVRKLRGEVLESLYEDLEKLKG